MKRMQVFVEPAEYRAFLGQARSRGMSLAEWVRQALRAALRQQPAGDRDRRLAAIRAAAAHQYPKADIEQMVAETAAGDGELPSDLPSRIEPCGGAATRRFDLR